MDQLRSFPARMRDRARALRHLFDVRAQIVEHPWEAVAGALLAGAWLAGESKDPRPVAVETGGRRISTLVIGMVTEAALSFARTALLRHVGDLARQSTVQPS
jgi:hypothetical protein